MSGKYVPKTDQIELMLMFLKWPGVKEKIKEEINVPLRLL